MCRTITSSMKVIDSMFVSRNMDTASYLKKAKLLLGSYRHICWASQGMCRIGTTDDYLISDDEIDNALDYLMNFSPTEEKRVFEGKLKALFDAKWMMELVDEAMVQVNEFPDAGDMYFNLLSKCYLSKFKYGESELLELLNIERSTYYDRKKEAVLIFAWALWGTVLPKTMAMLDDADSFPD